MSGPEQAAAVTPGQAAYEAYLAHLQGADPGYGQWVKPFADIDKHDRAAWDTAAQAAVDAAPDFATAFHDDVTELRALVAEILAEFGTTTGEWYLAGVGPGRIARWRELAGLEAAK